MRNLGHCSACERPAEMGASGNWWHLGPTCTSRGVVNADPDRWEPAEFIPERGALASPHRAGTNDGGALAVINPAFEIPLIFLVSLIALLVLAILFFVVRIDQRQTDDRR